MKRPNLNQDQKSEIEHLREEQGLSYVKIAAQLRLSKSAVWWHCLINNIEKPGFKPCKKNNPVYIRNGHIVRPYTPEEDRKLLELDQQGLRYGTIARRIGRQRNSVWARLATLAKHDEYGLR